MIVIGAGVIGLATAWRAAERGLRVTVVDPEPASGASHVAAGMLTAVSELNYGEEALLSLAIAAQERYGSFVAELEELTGLPTGHRTDGLVQVAFDADDMAWLNDLRAFQDSLGLPTERLSGRECRSLEPMLAPSVRGGLFAPQDGSVDPRRLTGALLSAVERSGGTLVRERAERLIVRHDRAEGVVLGDGTELAAGSIVLAAGPWSHLLDGLPPGVVPTVRPVKGQVLRLRGDAALLNRTVRGVVKGSSIYLVPRTDGEFVIGATQEELGYDRTVTAGGVWELLRDARELVPGVTELRFAEQIAGLRPGSPDNAPMLGATDLPGLLLATGHFRNGILLAPITGDIMAEVLATGSPPELAEPFAPTRFTPAGRGRTAGEAAGAGRESRVGREYGGHANSDR